MRGGGIRPKHKKLDKTLLFSSNLRYDDKDCMKDVRIVYPFQFYTRKILCPRYFSPVACTPRKVIRQTTSDFDAFEIDLDMQMVFLNAAPLSLQSPEYSHNHIFLIIKITTEVGDALLHEYAMTT